MTQHGELEVRRTLGNDAVVQHIALHELRQPGQRLFQALFKVLAVADEGEVGENQRLLARPRPRGRSCRDARPDADGPAGGRSRRRSAPRSRIGGGSHPFVVADPGDDAGGDHVALPRHRRPAPFLVGPVVDQPRGQQAAPPRIAAVAQIAQPAEIRSGHRATAATRRRAATADRPESGRTVPALPQAENSPAMSNRCPQQPDRRASRRAPQRRSFVASCSRASGNRETSPGTSGRACGPSLMADLPADLAVRRAGTERIGRAPETKGSPGRLVSEATSDIRFVLWPGRSCPDGGGVPDILPHLGGYGDGVWNPSPAAESTLRLALEPGGRLPRFTPMGRP